MLGIKIIDSTKHITTFRDGNTYLPTNNLEEKELLDNGLPKLKALTERK